MNKIVRYIQSYLIFGFPFMIAGIFWNNSTQKHFFIQLIQEIVSLNLILWFTALTFFLILLVLAPTARELTLRRLANIQERDEREEYITGKASRVTYISTLSLLILLFFNSIISLNITKLPDNQAINGKQHALNLNLGFNLLEKQAEKSKPQEAFILFNSTDISLSKPLTLLILIGWQLIVFNYISRREKIRM